MSLERGGRGDKSGNRYEDRFFAQLVLELLLERLVSIEVEPLGREGVGVEYIATAPDGERRYYQCKGSNGIQSSWRPCDLDNHTVFQNAKAHILSGKKHAYYFISPIPYDELDSLCNRARTCNGSEAAFREQVTNSSLRKWQKHCAEKFQETGTQLVYLLSHCYFELEPIGEEHRRRLESLISIIFVENDSCSASAIRVLLERFANDQSYWGKPICELNIVNWLESQGVHRRIMRQDPSCLHRILELNRTYVERFQSIGSMLIHRIETDKVLEQIRSGKSVILQGSAGAGKSGCIQEVIQVLKDSEIPFLVLSLDKDQPERSPDQYGCLLDLPDSPVAALYRIAGGQRCVLIFDQLDALRWTNSRTSTMLDVCKAMIRQTQEFNHHEGGQISCIFAVRTFDYETDPGLRNLLNPSRDDKTQQLRWETITIGLLSKAHVQSVTGDSYPKLSVRLQTLLQTPSNLYIWTQIKSEVKNTVTTLFQLMDEWWQQTLTDCESKGVAINATTQCYNQLITSMRSRESLFVPLLQITDRTAIDALVSCGVLKKVEGKVFFCHQSFLDYFLAVDNLNRLCSGEQITAFLGSIDKQTPDVRYQLLMLLQYLSKVDHKMFLRACQDLLESPDVRYYFRCCAFEVLGQSDYPNRNDWELLSAYYQNPEWHSQIVRAVFWGHPAFIRLLFESAPNYPWHKTEGNRLLRSIVQEDPELVWTILQKPEMDVLQPNELYEIVGQCTSQSSNVFSMRINLLLNNVGLLQDDFALYDLIAHGCVQAIPVIKVWILSGPDYRKNVHFLDETISKSYVEQNCEQIVTELLPAVLEVAETESKSRYMSDWSSKGALVTAERQIVQFIQFALNQLAEKEPKHFFQCVSLWTHIESPIKQELFLHAMEYLPLDSSDEVLQWLLSDFDRNAFEETGIEKNQLSCSQRIIQRFSPYCSETTFIKLEQTLMHWSPPVEEMRTTYQYRMRCHKAEGGGNYYNSFWGDLQSILLSALFPDRTAKTTKELIEVLKRKFPESSHKFDIFRIGMAHYVSSPIEGHLDRISDKSWLRIISNMSEYPPERNGERRNSGIESTPPMFARSLSTAAKKEPVRFAALSLSFPQNVSEEFVDAVVNALDSSEVPLPLTCKVLRRFCQKPSAQLAISFSHVLLKRATEDWPTDILQKLIEIVDCYKDSEPEFYSFDSHKKSDKLSCEDLLQGSINCVRGCAFEAIGELLWNQTNLAFQFEKVVKRAVEDENPAILFAVMDCAVPWYNIDKAFSKILFDQLLERDLRTLGARQAFDLLYRFYEIDSKFYTSKLKNACQSSINDLKKRAAEMIAVMIVTNHWTVENLMELPLNDQQADAICRQAVIYFNSDDSHACCKRLLLHLADCSTKLPSLSLLFINERIQVQRDKNFLMKLLKKSTKNRLEVDILHYLKENDISSIDCADVLLAVCKSFLDSPENNFGYHMEDIISCVARLFHAGKENPSILRTCLDIWDAIYHRSPLSVQPLSDLLEQG